MILYKMTATFGKLEHQTLVLQPGLNIIQAPNEWGKSTWCAFLTAMLYGMETRTKSTKAVLAEKEKFAPWSGCPMEGRIDLNWNHRDITIERRTKGRIPFGAFRAYETATGLEIPELTGTNCGQTLLGVERSVFVRAGFIRLSDLPVTQDEALRRRLNALVTTGDESGAGDILAGKLRDLKNRCRYNRSGLLPQAEAELADLQSKQQEADSLRHKMEDCENRLTQVEAYLNQLKNHQTALDYAAAQADADQVQEAQTARDEAADRWEKLDALCRTLPPREAAEQSLRAAQTLQQQWMSVQMEAQMLPDMPSQPEPPDAFRGIPPEMAAEKAKKDGEQYKHLLYMARKPSGIPWILLAAGFAAGGALAFLRLAYGAAAALAAAIISSVLWLRERRRRQECKDDAKKIAGIYGCDDPEQWTRGAEAYIQSQKDYQVAMEQYRAARGDLDQRGQQLQAEIMRLTQDQGLQECIDRWQKILSAWDAWTNAYRDCQQAENHLQRIQTMAKTAAAPEQPDTMTYNQAQTARLISDYGIRLRQLQMEMGQLQGRMDAMGDRRILNSRAAALRERIGKLEETYGALDFAQRTLSEAMANLQRRFAPRIAARAQEIFSKLTGGRYDRLSLTQELAVNTGAGGEDTLRPAQWRSEGTVDQLYLALRLAVAEELTPDAPLVLDDVLVRFDDQRLGQAMEILCDAAQKRQVLLFTCQSREAAWREEQNARQGRGEG